MQLDFCSALTPLPLSKPETDSLVKGLLFYVVQWIGSLHCCNTNSLMYERRVFSCVCSIKIPVCAYLAEDYIVLSTMLLLFSLLHSCLWILVDPAFFLHHSNNQSEWAVWVIFTCFEPLLDVYERRVFLYLCVCSVKHLCVLTWLHATLAQQGRPYALHSTARQKWVFMDVFQKYSCVPNMDFSLGREQRVRLKLD